MNENEKQDLRNHLEEYVLRITKSDRKSGRNMFICPVCGSGSGGRTSSGAFHITGDKWFCHSARHNAGGDIFTLYAEMNDLDINKDFSEIVDGLQQTLGLHRTEIKTESVKKTMKDNEKMKDIERYASQIDGSPAESYLLSRGFNETIIHEYRLGYDDQKGAVVIPYPNEDYYTERYINKSTDEKNKYYNLPGEAPLFIIKGDESSDYYFITEGQLDALSLIQSGAKNVIASHYPSKIEKLIKERKIDGVIIVGDRDPEEKRSPKDDLTPGEKNVATFKKLFDDNRIKNLIVYPPKEFKDSNETLTKDPDALRAFVDQSLKDCQKLEDLSSFRMISASDYVSRDLFGNDIEYFRRYRDRKTGFRNIDKYLTLYPGLACMTGATSLGKTSFCSQLADQLVGNGETVLYFTLEQLTIELVTKSLARRYYEKGGRYLNNIDIKNGASDDVLTQIKNDYAREAKNLHFIECDFTVSADMIVQYVEDYIKRTKIKPIVFVDYLQIVSAPDGSHYDDRERIDDAVKKFKLLSKKKELFIMLISNMARTTYREKLGEDSFKESGLIEYTCDYLFGLQLSVLEDDSFFMKEGKRGGLKETNKSQKQDMIDEASEAIPKEVVFKAMKNRNGKKVFRAFFKYYPNYDLFEIDDGSRYDKGSSDKEDEFKEITLDDDPFELT